MKTLRPWLIVAGLFAMALLTIVDRVAMSASKAGVARELALDDRRFGFVFAAFSVGYALLQVPSGRLADRFGARRFLAVIVAAWSVFTTATAVVGSLGWLLLVRLLFGAAEAGAFPGAARAIYSWVSAGQRGFAQGLLMAGSRLGAALGLALTSYAMAWVGWHGTFHVLGAVGLVWAVAWFILYRDGTGGVALAEEPGAFEWRWLATANSAYILGQYFCSNFTFYLAVNWLLPYLQNRYGLGTAEAGTYASVPLYFGMAANWVSGGVGDALYRRGHRRLARALPAACGFGLACGAVLLAAQAETIGTAVVFFGLATFGADLALSPSWAVCADIAGPHTGTFSGAMNMAGNVGALVSSLAFPYLAAWTGNPKTYFYLVAVLNVAGLYCWTRIRPGALLARPDTMEVSA
ncbi:MAG: MFS transporter [Acidobacteria bacterium]|nr:MFS transporter [Acidobacteriota bacterium]